LKPISLSLLCVAVLTVAAAQTPEQILSTMAGTTQYKDVAISGDGRWVAYTVNLRNKDNTASRNSEIWLLDTAASGVARRLTSVKPLHSEHSAVFSPDGRQVAYLSDAAKTQQLELYVQPVAGGTAKKLTNP
jgi:Tol biopolymer transport system component